MAHAQTIETAHPATTACAANYLGKTTEMLTKVLGSNASVRDTAFQALCYERKFSFLTLWLMTRLCWLARILLLRQGLLMIQPLIDTYSSAYWCSLSLLTDPFSYKDCLVVLCLCLLSISLLYISRPLGTMYLQAWLGYFPILVRFRKLLLACQTLLQVSLETFHLIYYLERCNKQ
jgi:hypothetical protein